MCARGSWRLVLVLMGFSFPVWALTGNGDSEIVSIDTVSPEVSDGTCANLLDMEIQFSEPMLSPGVMDVNAYTLSGEGIGTLSSHPSEVLGSNPYTLRWVSGEMKNQASMLITVSGVQDLAGNYVDPLHEVVSVTGMGVPPEFSEFMVTPPEAQSGDEVIIAFHASEALAAAPLVTVNDQEALLVSDEDGVYTFGYAITNTEPLGPANISIMGEDLAGNTGVFSADDLLVLIEPVSTLPLRIWPLIIVLIAGMLAFGKRRRWLIVGRLLVLAGAEGWAEPPQVSIVSVTQHPGGSQGTQLDIYFDLLAPNGVCEISVFLSKDGGLDGFSYPATSISGDVSEIPTGTGWHVVWDIRNDCPEENIPNARLRVVADDGIIPQHTLTYSAGLHGSLLGVSPQTVNEGTDGAEIWAIPEEGYAFSAWSDGSMDNPRQDKRVMADVEVAANFGQWAWTWMKGSSSADQPGTYGMCGVEDDANTPGARMLAASDADDAGNLWLFSGSGYDAVSSDAQLNDLWKYNTQTGKWTWVKGSNTDGQAGVYGELGVANENNTPGGRAGAAGWWDKAGHFWIFGGNDGVGSFNDLWKYDPGTGYWTWMKGSSSYNSAGVYGTLGQADIQNTPGARMSAVRWTDEDGNLWLFGGMGYPESGSAGVLNDLWKYVPSTGCWIWMKGSSSANMSGMYGSLGEAGEMNTPGARIGALSWTDPTGALWLFGGGDIASEGLLNDLWKYDRNTGMWTWVKGSNATNQWGVYGTQGVSALANAPGGRMGGAAWMDRAGALWLFGGLACDQAGNTGSMNDVWKYNSRTNEWTWIKGALTIGAAGIYGVQGYPHPDNTPGARMLCTAWQDASGVPWVFGGIYPEGSQIFNDLWRWRCPLLWAVTFETDGTAGASFSGAANQMVEPEGESSAVWAIAPVGYHFLKWTHDGNDYSTDNPLIVEDVSCVMTYTAHYEINRYTISYIAGVGGSISGTLSQLVPHGSNATIVTAQPSAEYYFVGWSDGVLTPERNDVNVTADIEVTAVFSNQYILTYNAGTNGSISGIAQQTVLHGENGSPVTATPDLGYTFLHWSDGSTQNPRTDMTVIADLSVTAFFEADLRPTITGFSINGTDLAAQESVVSLNNSATYEPTGYMASTSAAFTGATWQPYETAPAFTLADGLGPRTVYLKVRNANGVSDVVSDTIFLEPAMSIVSSGDFLMGKNGSTSTDHPEHTVTLSEYEIGKYLVTSKQFCDVLNWALSRNYLKTSSGAPWSGAGVICTGWNSRGVIDITQSTCTIQYTGGVFVPKTRTGMPSSTAYAMDRFPINQISWYGGVAFCNWLSEMEGLTRCYNLTSSGFPLQIPPPTAAGYRLPTEAEWERAAAWDGSVHWNYAIGSNSISSSRCNYNYNNPLGFASSPYLSPVGWYDGVHVNPNGGLATVNSPSPVGCYDMNGLLWEWVQDWYSSTYYTDGSSIDPIGPASGSERCIRGGAFNAMYATYARNKNSASNDILSLGFRVARTP